MSAYVYSSVMKHQSIIVTKLKRANQYKF